MAENKTGVDQKPKTAEELAAEQQAATLAAQAAELAALRAENEALAAANAALKEQNADGKWRTPLTVELTVEDANGKNAKAKYGIKEGHPTLRLEQGVFPTEAVLKAITEKTDLEGPKGKIPVDKVKAQLERYAAKGVSWLVKVAAVMLLLAVAMPAQAQIIRNGGGEAFAADTLTNTDAANFVFSKELATSSEFVYAWQVQATNISGTSTIVVLVQESLFDDGDNWVTMDTIALTSAGNVIETGTVVGKRQRLRVTSSGTGVTRILPVVRYRNQLQ